MQKKSLLVALVLYILATTVTFTYLYAKSGGRASVSTGSTDTTDGTGNGTGTALSSLLKVDPGAPKDQECPINGKMYTKVEKDAWDKRRPLAVMIENSPDARPQSGLTNADAVFEIVAEGGITRFMGIFFCNAQAQDTTLAPIRSARTYFIDYASGFNRPLYTHVGGAEVAGPADALSQLSQYGWTLQNDINGLFTVGYPEFVRNADRLGKPVATEHTVETTTEYLWKIGQKRGWTNMSPEMKQGKTVVPGSDWKTGYKPWVFEKEAAASGTVKTLSYDFWSGYSDFAVKWDYDETSHMYKRTMAGEPHVDLNNKQQIMAANVIVLLTTEKGPIDEKKHMLYGTTGSGDAIIFKDGSAIQAHWNKKERESALTFTDSKGKDIPLARGLTWISVLSKTNKVNY